MRPTGAVPSLKACVAPRLLQQPSVSSAARRSSPGGGALTQRLHSRPPAPSFTCNDFLRPGITPRSKLRVPLLPRHPTDPPSTTQRAKSPQLPLNVRGARSPLVNFEAPVHSRAPRRPHKRMRQAPDGSASSNPTLGVAAPPHSSSSSAISSSSPSSSTAASTSLGPASSSRPT